MSETEQRHVVNGSLRTDDGRTVAEIPTADLLTMREELLSCRDEVGASWGRRMLAGWGVVEIGVELELRGLAGVQSPEGAQHVQEETT